MDNGMTDFQFKSCLKSIIAIIKDCKTVDEAVEKIEALLED